MLLLTSAAWLAQAQARSSDRDSWIRVDTQNFVLFSEVDARHTRRIGERLESLRWVLSETSHGMRVHSPLPTLIYLFRNDRSFRGYKLGEDGQPLHVSGYFVATSDGNYVAVDAAADDGSLGIVYHEYLHYFIENNAPNTPLWLNEGLAELYSTFRSGAREAEVGLPIADHLETLRREKMLSLDQLFQVTTRSPDYNEAQRQGVFYAQSWALAHYLLIANGDQGKLAEFLFKMDHGEQPLPAFEEVYGLNARELQGALRTYIRRPLSSFESRTVPIRRRSRDAEVQTRSLSRAESFFHLGDLLAHHPPVRFGEAERLLRKSLELEPISAAPYMTLARLRELDDRQQEAIELYRKVIELSPDDPDAYARCGWALIEQFSSSVPPGARYRATPPPLREARRLFKRSLELDENQAESLAGFARTFLYESGDVAEDGLEAAERASLLLPSRDDILHDRIVLLASAKLFAKARQLLEHVLQRRSDDIELIQSASAAVMQGEIAHAVELMNGGQGEEALCRLQQLAKQTTDPTLRQEVQTQIRSMKDQARQNLHISLYNQAAELASRGELEEAIEELAALIELDIDSGLRNRAESALVEFRRVAAHNRKVFLYNTAVELVRSNRTAEARDLLEEVLAGELDQELERQARGLLSQLR